MYETTYETGMKPHMEITPGTHSKTAAGLVRDCGTAAALFAEALLRYCCEITALPRDCCETAAALVRHWCGTGAALVRQRAGTAAALLQH